MDKTPITFEFKVDGQTVCKSPLRPDPDGFIFRKWFSPTRIVKPQVIFFLPPVNGPLFEVNDPIALNLEPVIYKTGRAGFAANFHLPHMILRANLNEGIEGTIGLTVAAVKIVPMEERVW